MVRISLAHAHTIEEIEALLAGVNGARHGRLERP
jgi:selenocysteine lyase/cysteine desulfurase